MSNVLELALEALEAIIFNKPYDGKFSDVLASIKEAIKRQGEPVAYRCKWKDGILPDGHPQNGWQITDWIHPANRDSMIIEPLYTSAPTMPDAHELWAAAQLANGEVIEDGVARIEAMLSAAQKGE